MDRRVVVGLAGIVLAGFAETCQAQNAASRDPSAGNSVGMVPLQSINESINNTSNFSSVVPMAPSAVPSSPVGVGPAGTLPRAPIPRKPVSMTPIDSIGTSINRGHGLGYFSHLFDKPADRPAATILRTPPRVESIAKLDKQAIPSIWSEPPAVQPGAGRPAPYAGRKPEVPRAQADPLAQPAARPAPFADERPRSARPQSTPSNPPVYRAAEIPSTPPTDRNPPESALPERVVPEPAPSPIPVTPEPVAPAPVLPEPVSTLPVAPAPVLPEPAPVIPEPALPVPSNAEP
jgi:hypothetical protein